MTHAQNPAIRLDEASLASIPPRVRVPTYDRRSLGRGLAHIGVGGFHRAHQAVFLDDLLHRPDHAPWGCCGIGLLDQDARMRDALESQDNLYTVIERSEAGDSARVIGSLVDYRLAPDDPEAVLEVLASEQCRIVSLTITEGGYYLNEGSGEFNDAHPDIVHDLQHPNAPRGTFGFLVEALDRRRQRGVAPFTIMSCDNLSHNGDLARRMVLAFTEHRDPALARWLAEHVAFPNSMVDRITPATTDEHRALVREQFGLDDRWPVVTEPFMQWVIEDRFPSGRPRWELVGAQMTADVEPYEKMKMRLLNASHQAMCYIGLLLGHEFAHETMADGQIRKLVETMMNDEVTPLLQAPEGIDLEAYKRTLVERFSNPTICDQLSRLATDGSVRIPGFVLPSIVEQLERSGPCRLLCFTVATWFRYLQGTDDRGRTLPINDAMEAELMERARRGGRDPGDLLGLSDVFGERLPRSREFVDQVSDALAALHEEGPRRALARYVDG